MKTHKYKTGGMWDGGWEIQEDVQCSEWGGGSPCPHCHSEKELVETRIYGETYRRKVWICPIVIVGYGCETTGICGYCVCEQLSLLNLLKSHV
jgi:hypothetical protein